MLRVAIERITSALGYVVMPKWRLTTHQSATHLRKLLDLERIDCVLDVGANRGQFRDFIRYAVGYTGPIVSFEPDPAMVSKLEERAPSDPNWHIYGYALGSKPGTLELNLTRSSGCNSFLKPDPRHVPGMVSAIEVIGQTSVPVKALDDVFPALQRKVGCANIFLKMDTQGFDMEVIKGATETLTHVRALQTEASVKPIYKGMPDYTVSIKAIQDLGFDLSGVFPISVDYTFPMMAEFDAVFVRSLRADQIHPRFHRPTPVSLAEDSHAVDQS